MQEEQVFGVLFVLAITTAIGALLSWLGRTVVTLLISYFVVGVVASFVAYLGVELFRLASGLNSLAEEANSPLLRFALEVADFGFLAAALGLLTETQRLWLISTGTLVVAIAVTLPFVTFANAVYSAMTADDGLKAAARMNEDVVKRLERLTTTMAQLQTSQNECRQCIDEITRRLSTTK